MYGKRMLAIACSGFLLAGMGSAMAVEDASAGGQQESSHASGTSVPHRPENQAQQDSGNANEAMENQVSTQQGEEQAPPTDTSDTPETAAESSRENDAGAGDMSEKATHERQGERKGQVVGALVDNSGRLQGYVIKTGKAGAKGANQYVVLPLESVSDMSGAPSEEDSATQTEKTGAMTRNAGPMPRQRLLERMYQQLQKQASQIRLLREQLAQQQPGMGGHGQISDSQQGPLSQIAHIIVDRRGDLQAVVLDSGVILMSEEWASAKQSSSDGSQENAALTDTSGNNTQAAGEAGERSRAVIIFRPQQ